MTISSFVGLIESELPPEMALPGDPVGTQLLPDDRPIRRVAAVYEIDDVVVRRAIEMNVDLLLAFHPLIYTSLSRIDRKSRVGRVVIDLLKCGTAAHVVHSIFDQHPGGTSSLLLNELGIEGIEALIPDDRRLGWGLGSIGWLAEDTPLSEIADLVRRTCGARAVRLTRNHDMDRIVRRIAAIGGSGMSFYSDAVRRGADVLITSDVRYHAFHAAHDAIPVIDPGHYESERFVVPGLHEALMRIVHKAELNVDLVTIDVDTNPVAIIN